MSAWTGGSRALNPVPHEYCCQPAQPFEDREMCPDHVAEIIDVRRGASRARRAQSALATAIESELRDLIGASADDLLAP